MNRDEIFGRSGGMRDFAFDRDVATVFDDMACRSIPFYTEIQRMAVEMAVEFLGPGGTVYDVGCSTGTTLLSLIERLLLIRESATSESNPPRRCAVGAWRSSPRWIRRAWSNCGIGRSRTAISCLGLR